MAIDIINDPLEYDPSFRPPVLTAVQRYNLQNQSWGVPRMNSKEQAAVDPVDYYKRKLTVYPSNSEVIWTGLQFQADAGGDDPYERMYANLWEDRIGGDTIAAKGYFIIDLLRRGQSRSEAYNANKTKYPPITAPEFIPPTDLTPGGAKIVQQFAGRVFYAGFSGEVHGKDIRSPNLSNLIAFSQLVRNKKDFAKCYQEGDPTSRDNADLVDTDGGFIKLSGAETIIGMVNMGSALAIIASNGVWTITGGSDYGFGATNYKSDKISSFGGVTSSSIVEEGERTFYWGDDGIYVIEKGGVDGGFQVSNLTETTIQTYYQGISAISKASVVGTLDASNRTVRWIYNTGENRFSAESITYELVLSIPLKAFYRNRIYNPTDNSIEVVSVFSAVQFVSESTEEDIIASGDAVIVGSDVVVVERNTVSDGLQSSRYLAFERSEAGVLSFSFAYYKDLDYVDWPNASEGVDAKAYVITGQITGGVPGLAKQAPYLVIFMKRTERGVLPDLTPQFPSGLLFRSQWDFSNTANSKKWSPLAQGYRYRMPLFIEDVVDDYDNGFDLVVTKNKLRGRGRALSLYMESIPGKDCRIVGWALDVNGNKIT